MADLEAVQNAVRSRFKTLVADVESVSVAYDNAPFTRPEGEMWVRLAVLPGEDQQITMGGSTVTYRMVGVALASIFCPIETGDKAAVELARVIQTTFRRVTASGVEFRSPSITRIGRVGNEYQINVSCPFRHDDIAA